MATKGRITPRITPVAFYLGDKELSRQRKDSLDKIAVELGFDNRSQLVQAIADGLIRMERVKRRGRPKKVEDAKSE